MSKNGFVPVIGIIIVAVLIVGGILFFNKPDFKNQTGYEQNNKSGHEQSGSQEEKGLFGRCEGKGATKLNTFPFDPKDIELITPMGRVQDSHVTPTDHQYIIPKGTKSGSIITSEPKKYQIKAPTDGFIVNIELFKEPVESAYRKDPYANNYLVVFEYSCDYYTRLIHIDTLSDEVNSQVKFDDPNSQHPYASPRIKVNEGEVIGTVGPHSFDFQIMDTTYKNQDIISPQN